MASYILPIYGRSGQIVICIDIANILAGEGEGYGVVEGGNLLVWHIGQTFRGAHIWHESLLRWYLQAAAAAHNSAPLSTIGPLDLRHIQSPFGARGKWRGVETMFVCMQITRSRHLPDTHNHQLSQLSSRPIEIENEIEIEMENAIANRDSRSAIRDARFAIAITIVSQFVIRIAIAANMQSILY